MARRADITPDLCRQLLQYDAVTGLFVWRTRPGNAAWNAKWEGKAAFATPSGNYLTGGICNHRFLAHRVAWAIYHGVWPSKQIDHINGDFHDNRIANLRDVDCTTNGRNRRLSIRNKTGASGVRWHKQRRQWQAHINIGKKQLHLGCFETFKEAAAARSRAERDLGYHQNNGRPR